MDCPDALHFPSLHFGIKLIEGMTYQPVFNIRNRAALQKLAIGSDQGSVHDILGSQVTLHQIPHRFGVSNQMPDKMMEPLQMGRNQRKKHITLVFGSYG